MQSYLCPTYGKRHPFAIPSVPSVPLDLCVQPASPIGYSVSHTSYSYSPAGKAMPSQIVPLGALPPGIAIGAAGCNVRRIQEQV